MLAGAATCVVISTRQLFLAGNALVWETEERDDPPQIVRRRGVHVCDREKCRELLHPKVAREDADTLFGKWGGVARFVLKKAYQEDQQKKLQIAVSSVRLRDIVRFAGGDSEACDEGSVHLIVHIHVDDGDSAFMTPQYRFASDFVLNSVRDQLYTITTREKLLNFISGSHEPDGAVGVQRAELSKRLKAKV